MKTPIFVVSLSVFSILVSGCQKKEELPAPEPPPSKVPAASNNAAAPSGYLGAIGRAEQSMEKTVDTAALNNAVQLFNAQEGHAPESLDELVQKKYIGKLPTPPFGTKLQYDKSKGTVSVVKQ
jgi:hypothetical protein